MTQPLKRPVEDNLPEMEEDIAASTDRAEPRWFFPRDHDLQQMDLAERYRRHRPQSSEQSVADATGGTPGYGELISARRMKAGQPPPPHANSAGQKAKTQSHGKPRPRKRGGELSLAKTYVLAALAAAVTGASVGYGASRFDEIKIATASWFGPGKVPQATLAVAATVPEKPAVTTIAKKSIQTATLDVTDVSGALNTYIPLSLHAEPGLENQDLILKLKGLPHSAYLTAGVKDRENAWQLSLHQLKDLKLVVPQSSSPQFDVAVAAVAAKSGELLAPVKEMTVALEGIAPQILPAAAPPASALLKIPVSMKAAAATTIPQPVTTVFAALPPGNEVQNLLGKGDMLFKSGDLATARQFYEQAFAKGAAAGALGMGRSYDPAVFRELNVQGMKADVALARDWYQRAANAGSTEAKAALVTLRAEQPSP